ncbi:MAG: sodium-dependent transporter [Gammaproteobacteria bacterium]|nr:sodium-dependent transporter [Gammaproteobacteria bacterium]
MSESRQSIHGEWSGRLAFILAATGSAVGLGNIWKFPYITGENGGGAFVLVYLLCVAAIGIPIMVAEIMLGRRGRSTPVNTMTRLAAEAGGSSAWKWLGWMGMLAGFLILSFYSVIGGWALAYVPALGSGAFAGQDAAFVGDQFASLLGSPLTLLAWHTLFMVLTMAVVARGVRGGLEKAVYVLMPGLFVLMLILVGYAMSMGHFARAVEFLFTPDFSKITGTGILIAMGHSFFTLSLGMGAIMIYGSYLPKRVSIARTTFIIAIADTTVALLAGLAIFPIVFSNGLEPGAGPGLVFETLPLAFAHMPGGTIVGTLFFVLLVFAAWTSSISLIEPAVTWLVEKRGMTRIKACLFLGMSAWLLGVGTVLSFNEWSEIKLFGKTFFDSLDFLTTNILLPLGGLLIAIFAGWVLPRQICRDELEMKEQLGFRIWLFLIRYVTPVAIFCVFLNVVGLI